MPRYGPAKTLPQPITPRPRLTRCLSRPGSRRPSTPACRHRARARGRSRREHGGGGEGADGREPPVLGLGARGPDHGCAPPGADALRLDEQRIVGRPGRLSARSPAPSAIIVEVAPSRVSTPSAGIPETSFRSSAASSAAAQAGPLPNATAFAAPSERARRPTSSRRASRVVDSAGQAREAPVEGRVGRELRPHAERGHDVAAERLGVRDGALVGDRDERARSGPRPDRRVRRSKSRRRTGRARRRRSPRSGRGTRPTRRRTSRTSPGRHANAPRASRPLGTAQDLRPRPPSSDASQRATADVVRRAVPARDDAPDAGGPEHRRDVGEAGSRVERCRERLRQLGQVAPQAGLVQHGRNPIPGRQARMAAPTMPPSGPSRVGTTGSGGSTGTASNGRQAGSTRSWNAGSVPSPPPSTITCGVERVREHGEHPRRALPLPRRRRRVCAGPRARPPPARAPAAGASARPLATASTGGAPSVIACPCAPAYGPPSTTRHTLAPVPTIANRNGETPDARAERRLGERRRPHVRLEDDARRLDRRAEIEVTPVDRVGARGPTVEVDELAQPDPDRQPPSAELAPPTRRSRRAPPRRRARVSSAAGGAREPARCRRRRDRRRSSSRRRRCRPRGSRAGAGAETCVFSSLYSLLSAAREAAPLYRGGNVKRRLTGLS